MPHTHDQTRTVREPPEQPTRTAGPGAGEVTPVPLGTFASDYDLLRQIGRGAFARVYLARQRSLGRLVAVKVSERAGGGEGTVLAALDHPHIVKVFAEATDPATGRTGLILQYVSGPHLGEVLADLFRDRGVPADGRAVLAAVDRRATDEVAFDPTALADREVYHGEYAAVVCRLGAKLADALATAHGRGILHCDLKPSNVLLDRYGRPLLADFNVAVNVPPDGDADPPGGTLAYMSPEHLAAFARLDGQPPVDRRTDLYALGLVLAEALTGLPPPAGDPRAEGLQQVLNLWTVRRADLDDWLAGPKARIPPVVWRVLRRCLAFDPAGRYADATALAAALRGAAELLERQATAPPAGLVARLLTRHPVVSLGVLTFLPHLVGSVMNIVYNRVAIPLSEPEVERFGVVTGWYNALVYPACVAAAVWVAWPVVRFLRSAADRMPTAELDALRRRAVRLGRWGAVLAAAGWFPGGVIFPLALTDWSVGFDAPRFGHFVVSFVVSGLIALTYSFLGIQAVVVRGILPRLMHPEQTPAERQSDAALVNADLALVPLVAATVPLSAAVVQTAFAPPDLGIGFRVVVTGLIVLGMVGLGVAIRVTTRLRRVAAAVCGG